jgi:molybdate transport system ATP-binding protein
METPAADGEATSILEASVSGASDGLTELIVGTQKLRLPLDSRRRGERVQLRILARDIVLATRRIEDTSIRNILAGRVETVRRLDAGTVEIRIDLEGQILKAHITAIACDALRIDRGASVYAMVKSVALGNTAGGRTQ